MLQLELDIYFDVIYITIYLQIGEVNYIKQPVIIQGDTMHVIQFFDDFIYIYKLNSVYFNRMPLHRGHFCKTISLKTMPPFL